MTFNPNDHLMSLKGKPYLPVAWRLVWFRQDHPGWGIRTQLLEHDTEIGRAVVKASVSVVDDAAVVVIAEGHKQETRKDFPDYLEKAETGAIGRALAALGYGTQFAPELEEGERLADGPVTLSGRAGMPSEAHMRPPVGTSTQSTGGVPAGPSEAMITSVQDPLYQRYASLAEQAQRAEIEYEAFSVPVSVAALRTAGIALKQRLEEHKERSHTK